MIKGRLFIEYYYFFGNLINKQLLLKLINSHLIKHEILIPTFFFYKEFSQRKTFLMKKLTFDFGKLVKNLDLFVISEYCTIRIISCALSLDRGVLYSTKVIYTKAHTTN